VLIPEVDYAVEADAPLQEIYPRIFEIELDTWYTDRTCWPTRRDYQTFVDWFDIEICEMVLDVSGDEIIHEPYEASDHV